MNPVGTRCGAWQADASTVRNFWGAGLGLTLSPKCCRRMSRHDTVQSKSGKGWGNPVTLPEVAPATANI